MPRRQFLADFEAAQVPGKVDFIDDLKTGDEDGQFTFSFKHPLSEGPAVINALISDVGDYPRSHEYLIFMADDAPQALCKAINSGLPSTRGKTVIELLKFVTSTLAASLTNPDGDRVMPDSQNDSDLAEEDSEEDESEGELDLNESLLRAPSIMNNLTTSAPTLSSPFRRRLNDDLRAAKSAGLKVGHLGPLTDGQAAYVTISCRIKKLGISEEAMQAWKIEPDEYLILLIQYPSGYKPLNSLRNYNQSQLREYMQMRVGASKTYKPTIQEAILAFEKSNRDGPTQRNATMTAADSTGFREVFISKPLNNLMNERLLVILKLRGGYSGMQWSGAEEYYNEFQGASDPNCQPDQKYLRPEEKRGTYPAIVTADHFGYGKDNLSFPLLAMQFLLRHFVRCTEFCLICHRHLSDDLQAIKPYVCDKPLCLYQYMSLGFGPSIEHEIMAQPYVVDLLVSFCYLSAVAGKLKHFPTGLSIMVPPLAALQTEMTVRTATDDAAIPVKLDISRQELLFEGQAARNPIKQGDWIVLRIKQGTPALSEIYHCRVVDVFYPSIRLDQLIPGDKAYPPHQPLHERPPTPPDAASVVQHRTETSPKWIDATVDIYNVSFDELELFKKQQLMIKLLDTVPDVKEMQEFLVTNHSSDLRTWSGRISSSALALLRWIIASNRACIMQVDDFDTPANGHASTSERIHGMPNWAQFRFAMGAPDKEQRFVKAVKQTSERLKLEYPTLFAWHGSPVHNWHSIIREGLNFIETAHGRAFGHGVYHSLQYATSLGYTGHNGYSGSIVNNWPASLLQIKSAMSLNEIVNAPSEFVSNKPHLVVAQLDWIQTRYLFVRRADQTNGQSSGQSSVTARANKLPPIGVSARATLPPIVEQEKPKDVLLQDPKMTPFGETMHISIPAKLGSSSHHRSLDRVIKVKGDQGSSKIRKVLSRFRGPGTQTEPIELDEGGDDGCSVATLEEDRELLDQEPPTEMNVSSLVPKSDFVPGALDHSKLPRMPEPSYANITATKRLQADFRALLKVQNNSSPEELGWYIDPEKLDNVYQWIVELHTFEAFRDKGKDIPLVDDMKKRKISSIVLELRFPGSYPMSPPFVRVIRPRFLGFQKGGGGHVTAGGALCMELLTNSGWSAVSTIEAVLLQVRMAIASTEPKPARLSSDEVYGVGEAIEAYKRACMTHGWQIPPDFASLAQV